MTVEETTLERPEIAAAPPPRVRWRRLLPRWAAGLVLATLIIWPLTAPFLTTFTHYKWDPQLQRYVEPEGFVKASMTEGWAQSHYGKHGIIGIPDVMAVHEPKIILWGNSFVEGAQLSDDLKLARQTTDLFRQRGLPVVAVPVVHPGWSLADCCLRIPEYEKLVDPVCHVVVVTTMKDTLPDGRAFVDRPEFAIRDSFALPAHQDQMAAMNRLHLLFLGRVMGMAGRLLESDGSAALRFTCGPAPHSPAPLPTCADPESRRKAWDFLLGYLRSRTKRPIVLFYAAQVPTILKGAIQYDDPDRQPMEEFAGACRRHGIEFVNVTSAYCDFYRQTGCFPLGYINGFVSHGHWNQYGHRLMAEAIVEHYIKEHPGQ
jgi:hypothetical protein